MIQGNPIWTLDDIPGRDRKRVELTNLIRFKDHWYCGFREADVHHNHPSGRVRIIRSRDGVAWETATVFDWDCADVREPHFSITAEGLLMVNTAIYFTSRKPRTDGFARMKGGGPPKKFDKQPNLSELDEDHPFFFYLYDNPRVLADASESVVNRQSVTWLSADGINWSSAHACPTGANLWRWDVTWHDGMGYSLAYNGVAANGILFRTRDGRNWRVLKDDVVEDGTGGNESSLVFGDDGTAYCLRRHNAHTGFIGVGEAPHYQNWTWRKALVDWHGDGNVQPVDEFFNNVCLGGPKTLKLKDGRFLAVARALVPDVNDGRVVLFEFDAHNAILTKIAVVDGASYGGIAEDDDEIWITYRRYDAEAIMLAKAPLDG